MPLANGPAEGVAAVPASAPSPSEQMAHFTPGTVTTVDFTIRKPGTTDDGDQDGYIGLSGGGPDCDDTQPTIHPNATEACTMAVDLNCNGKVGCDDPACAGMSCIRPATGSTSIAERSSSMRSSACPMAPSPPSGTRRVGPTRWVP